MLRHDPLSATFAALADPTRRAILARLVEGEASVGELAEPFDLALPTVSRHLKVLERAKLITREKDAQWRRCRLAPAPLHDAAGWLDIYRQFWEASFDRLDAQLRRLGMKQGGKHGKRRNAKRRKRPGR